MDFWDKDMALSGGMVKNSTADLEHIEEAPLANIQGIMCNFEDPDALRNTEACLNTTLAASFKPAESLT
jgi:hypothetical protein